jgi:tripartite ATP-independent transporter DctM subunit
MNLLLAAALAAMVLLPLTESALRATAGLGISGAPALLQHLTLVVGMLGGAVAAREDRLLSLSTAQLLLRGRTRAAVRVFSYGVGAALSALLAWAAAVFVGTEKEAGKILAYGLPIWVTQSVLPLGFAVVAGYLVWQGGESWKTRGLTLLLGAGLILAALRPPAPPAELVWPALVLLLAATALGTPIFVTLGGAAAILFWGEGLPIASLPLDHYRQVVNPSIPTVPLFTLAGYFLAEGGASQRLIRVFQALFGRFRGGPAIVSALVCAFFTSFTGGSGVTILALGGLLLPILTASRYSERHALGLITGAGSLGILFPPCLPLILYAIVAKITMTELFLAGIVPGVLLVVLTSIWGIRRSPPVAAGAAFDGGEAARALWAARWELLLPVVALGGLFGGFATLVEAAALTAFYAFLVEALVHRGLRIRELPRVMSECGLLIGGVLLILGVALGFSNYLIDAQIPARAVDWARASIDSPLAFLLLLNLLLLVVGCLMDIFSAIVVVAPLLLPLGEAFGVDPVHLGIIFLANLQLGYLTPPVGMNLFLASYRFSKPLPEVTRATLPLILVLLAGVLLITYVPALTTTLPSWWGGKG